MGSTDSKIIEMWRNRDLSFDLMPEESRWEHVHNISKIPVAVLFGSINKTYTRNKRLCSGYARQFLFADLSELINMYHFKGDLIIHRFMKILKHYHRKAVICQTLHRLLDHSEQMNQSQDLVFDLVFEHSIFSEPILKFHTDLLFKVLRLGKNPHIVQEFINSDCLKYLKHDLKNPVGNRSSITCFFALIKHSSEQQILNEVDADLVRGALFFIQSVHDVPTVCQIYESLFTIFRIKAKQTDIFTEFMKNVRKFHMLELLQWYNQDLERLLFFMDSEIDYISSKFQKILEIVRLN